MFAAATEPALPAVVAVPALGAVEGVWRGRDWLAGRQGHEVHDPVGLYGHGEPAGVAVEDIPEVKRDREQAVSHGDAVGRECRAFLGAHAGIIKQGEAEVVKAVGGIRAARQPALIGERRADRGG